MDETSRFRFDDERFSSCRESRDEGKWWTDLRLYYNFRTRYQRRKQRGCCIETRGRKYHKYIIQRKEGHWAFHGFIGGGRSFILSVLLIAWITNDHRITTIGPWLSRRLDKHSIARRKTRHLVQCCCAHEAKSADLVNLHWTENLGIDAGPSVEDVVARTRGVVEDSVVSWGFGKSRFTFNFTISGSAEGVATIGTDDGDEVVEGPSAKKIWFMIKNLETIIETTSD